MQVHHEMEWLQGQPHRTSSALAGCRHAVSDSSVVWYASTAAAAAAAVPAGERSVASAGLPPGVSAPLAQQSSRALGTQVRPVSCICAASSTLNLPTAAVR